MKSVYGKLYFLMFGVFAVVTSELGIVPLLPSLAKTAHVTISQAGYLITAFAMTVTFIGPIFTKFMSFMRIKYALMLAQSLLLICDLFILLFPYYPIMFLCRIIGGLGHPLFFSLALTYAVSAVPLEKRAKGSAILFLGVNLACILGFPIISVLNSYVSWKMSYLFMISCHLCTILGMIWLLPKNMGESNRENASGSFKDKGFILGIPAVALTFTGVFIVYSYFTPYLESIGSFHGNELSIALILFGFFGIIGNGLASFIPTRKMVPWMLFALCLWFLFFIGLYHINIHVMAYTFIIICIWGFLQSLLMLTIQVWFTLDKVASLSVVNSLAVSSSNLGITGGSFFGGFLLGVYGIHILPLVGILILMIVFLCVVLDTWIQSRKKI